MALTITTIGITPLRGTRLILEKAAPRHAEFLHRCYQRDEFMNCYRLAQDRNIDASHIRQRLNDEQNSDPKHLRRLEWVIKRCSREDIAEERGGIPIGIAALADYQAAHNRAEFLIGIIDSEDRRGGLGLEATLLVLEFAFHQARLHKLVSIVYAFNQIAQDNTMHLGFHQEALLRDHYFNPREKCFIDLYQNRLLRYEFFANEKFSRWSKRLLGRDITKEAAQNNGVVNVMSQEQLNTGSILLKQAATSQ